MLNSGVFQIIVKVKIEGVNVLAGPMISIAVCVVSIIRLLFANAEVKSVSLVVQQKR